MQDRLFKAHFLKTSYILIKGLSYLHDTPMTNPWLHRNISLSD